MTKEEKLNKLQSTHRRLLTERIPLVADMKKKDKTAAKAHRIVAEKSKEIHDIGLQIFEMKHGGSTPHVTDHALIRYLERVESLDVVALKDKVAAHKDAVREGNVIVTVNEDLTICECKRLNYVWHSVNCHINPGGNVEN